MIGYIRNKLKNAVYLIFIILFIIISTSVNAGMFDVGVTVCSPEWHCTSYDQDTCGVRTCIDINTCGVNTNKPGEYLSCPPVNTDDDNPDNDDDNSDSPILTPNHYITISSDVINAEMTAGSKLSKYIQFKTSDTENYELSISSSNSEFSRMITLSESSISGDGMFLIDINSAGIPVGLYNGIVKISSNEYVKNILIIINIRDSGPKFDLLLNNSQKIVNTSTVLNPIIRFYDQSSTNESMNISYVFLSSQGDILFSFYAIKDSGTPVSLPMPLELLEGFYILKVSASSSLGTSTEYMSVYADPNNNLKPYVEQTSLISNIYIYKNYLFYSSGILILLIIILLIIKYQDSITRLFYHENKMIKMSIGENSTLRKSYERGFISKKTLEKYTSIDKTPSFNNESIVTNKSDIINISIPNSIMISKISNNQTTQFIIKDYSRLAPVGKEFILHNGTRIYSIKELYDMINNIDDAVFYHHLNSKRNDFANWVNDVFDEKELGIMMRGCTSKDELKKTLS